MGQEDRDEPLHDLGILFVHGIGQTGRAETLLHFGEPLRQCIETIAAPATDNASVKATISAARLDPDPGGGPVRAELRINGAGATESSWLLAEAWWAKKFPTPTIGEIVSWSFKVVPWTLVSHFDRQLRRLGFRVFESLDEGHLTHFILRLLRWLVEPLKVVAALAFLPLLLLVLALVTLLGMVPYAPVRDFARSGQRKLAATIGDSFVLMDQPIIAAAITDSVRQDLEWLAARCKRVVVVAHSQGAAIAHRVLRQPLTAPCDLFVTFGSGLAKLDEIQHAANQKARIWLWMSSAGALLAAGSLGTMWMILWHGESVWALMDVLVRTALIVEIGATFAAIELFKVNLSGEHGSVAPESPPAWGYVPLYLLLACSIDVAVNWPVQRWSQVSFAATFAAGLALTYLSLRRWQVASGRSLNKRAQWLRDRSFYRERFQLHNRRYIRWFDFFASADPVPNGPLLDDFAPQELRSCEVTNADSVFGDHTNYWKNKDEFLPRLADQLLTQAGLGSRPLDPRRVAQRRRWRVGWRVAARWILAFAAASLVYRWLASRPEFLVHLANDVPGSAFPLFLLHGHATRVLLLTAAGLWAVAAFPVLLVWHLWDANEITVGLSARDYSFSDWRFLTLVVLLWAGVAAGVWNIFGVPGFLVVALIFLGSAIVLVREGPRSWLTLLSESGPRQALRQLRLAELARAAETGFQKKNSYELTRVGLALLGLDDDLAIKALSEAGKLGSANAAWRLGLYFDGAANRASDASEKSRLRCAAKAEFERGMKLGDANCGWFLGLREADEQEHDKAISAYRTAFDLGDVKAASSLGWALEQQGRVAEALTVYQEGERRGDGYSASLLASRLERQSKELRDTNPAEAKTLRDRALVLYRRAFDLGHVEAALRAGRLRREAAEIERARRAFAAGTRLRDPQCAYELGLLEDEELQDSQAARAAYALAIRLDESGACAVRAHYRVGLLLQSEGKLRAAEHRFRAASGVAGAKIGCAEAAVALGRLLEGQYPRDRAKHAFLRAMELRPRYAALPFVEFLERTVDTSEAFKLCSQDLSKFAPEATFRLGLFLRYSHPPEAEKLFRLALQGHWAPAAVELYKMLMVTSIEEANSVLDTVLSFGQGFAFQVSELFEKDQQTFVAADLRKRLEGLP